ncbi:MAG: glycosyltransferase family 1 protein [Thermoprotei archaeon]|nr:MAG: glycosyltransferase family 1 protein [Thermoprotei archaeon]
MRVVLASQWFPPDVGGVSSHVRDLAYTLVRRGHEVLVLTRRGRRYGDLRVEGLSRVECASIPLSMAGRGRIASLLTLFKPDLVHVHHAFTPIPLAAAAAAAALGYPTVLTNHSSYLDGWDLARIALGKAALPVRAVLSKVDEVIAVSRSAARFIAAFLPPGRQVRVIPNGVDAERFKPCGPAPLRDSISADFVILFVGRLVYRKGLTVLLKALSLLKDLDLTLVVVGEGPLRPSAEALARRLAIEDRVMFLGSINEWELPGVYRSADVVAVPSLYGEAFGIVALEAMATGRPVVASRVGGLSELVIGGETGVLVPPGDPEALAEALRALYEDEELRAQMGRRGRARILELYDWRVVIRHLEEVYEAARERLSVARPRMTITS